MVDQQRLGAFDAILAHVATSAPANLGLFHKNCVNAGFGPDAATTLTVAVLKSLLQVPNPSEQPNPKP